MNTTTTVSLTSSIAAFISSISWVQLLSLSIGALSLYVSFRRYRLDLKKFNKQQEQEQHAVHESE